MEKCLASGVDYLTVAVNFVTGPQDLEEVSSRLKEAARNGKTVPQEIFDTMFQRYESPGKNFDIVLDVDIHGKLLGTEANSARGRAMMETITSPARGNELQVG